jgi:chromosomal replication initiator protein
VSAGQVYSQKVKDLIAAHFDLPVTTMESKSRPDRIAWPRQMAMYFCRQYGMRFEEIGRLFRKDHGTVMYACKVVVDRINVDQLARKDFEVIKEKVSTLTI